MLTARRVEAARSSAGEDLADGAYTSEKLAHWCKEYGGWDLEIVGRDPEILGFAVQPRRWVWSGVLLGWCATAACA